VLGVSFNSMAITGGWFSNRLVRSSANQMRFYRDKYTWSAHWGKDYRSSRTLRLGHWLLVFDFSQRGWLIGIEVVKP
jgi:hypothetical protein